MHRARFSAELAEMDFDLIHGFLSNSYWAKNIPRETLERGLQNSLCFALFDAENRQIAFARMITDRATFAYLADVFVVEDCRGQGLSRLLVERILECPDLQGLRRIALATRDAHGLYEKFGFTPLNKPDYFMEIWNPDIYKKTN